MASAGETACVAEASGRVQGDFSLSMSLGLTVSSDLRSLPLTVSFLVRSRVGQAQSPGYSRVRPKDTCSVRTLAVMEVLREDGF